MCAISIVDGKGSVLKRWGSEAESDTIYYRLPCGSAATLEQLRVEYTLASNVSVAMSSVEAVRAIRRIFTAKLTSGGKAMRYTVAVEKPLELSEVVNEHIGHLRVVNNNPKTNKHGLTFSAASCMWWGKGESGDWIVKASGRLYYAAGPNIQDKFTERDSVYVVLYTEDGSNRFETCPGANLIPPTG
ncbi:MAG: hypothetical protein LBL94_07815 [Prevotellaceae bacterium]|nr:hypothetical protein [Prevotellaceae bacterium]